MTNRKKGVHATHRRLRKDSVMLSISKLADDYGTLKAKAKDIEDLLFLLRGQIIETGLSEIEGKLFKVTVSEVEKCVIDVANLRNTYPQIAKEFERISSSIVVKCNSR